MVVRAEKFKSELRQDPLYKPIEVVPAQPNQVESLWGIQFRAGTAAYPNEEAGITLGAVRNEMQKKRQTKIQIMYDAAKQPTSTRALFAATKRLSAVGLVYPNLTDGVPRIDNLYVEPDAQGNGAGGKLLDKAIGWHEARGSERIHIFVAQYLDIAIRLYQNRGFEIADEIVAPNAFAGNSLPKYEMILENPSSA